MQECALIPSHGYSLRRMKALQVLGFVRIRCPSLKKQEWIREETLNNNLTDREAFDKMKITDLLDYNETLAKRAKEEKSRIDYDDQLAQVIKQYESRLVRIQNYLDERERKLNEVLEENKVLTEQAEYRKDQLLKIVGDMIGDSEEIRENSILYLNEENDATTKQESMNKIKYLLVDFQKLNFEYEYSCINDLKDHILLLHQTLYDCLKRLSLAHEELNNQEKAWRKFCDGMTAEREKEKVEKTEIIEVGRKKIKELESTLEALRSEMSKQVKERDMKIDFLNKEMKKNVNVQHIRNIIIQFLTTNEKGVKEKLLPVIGTVLQFSQQELESVQQAWDGGRSPITRLFKFGGNGGNKEQFVIGSGFHVYWTSSRYILFPCVSL
eukprot:TRINITY_DN10481_c0_g1_i5.p1 TRINITY_DN10481_c0_g1~~TRINITY_DN10481_c0_g1_i5.p1  ORF type:complete len:382 (+),score=68.58 TRINITY_DN10481_c0_g1_i5:320-1465(+)